MVSMHVQSVDQVSAIKTIKRKITDLDRTKIEEQKKRSGPGMTWTSSLRPCHLRRGGQEAAARPPEPE